MFRRVARVSNKRLYLVTGGAGFIGSNIAEALVKRGDRVAGIFMPWIGNTGGSTLVLGDAKPLKVADLRERHEGWFPRFMAAA